MNRLNQFKQYSDDQIVSNILAGDIALYEIIIRRYNSYLFKVGRSYGFSHADTEDLMQESYINAFSSLEKFQNKASFKTWLVKIMLHQCYHKKQKFSFVKESSENNLEDYNTSPMFTYKNSETGKTVINRELGHVLENALLILPQDYRMVFTLRALNGLNTLETAEALSITQSNVKVRFSRAKSMLRSEIEKMYSPDEIFEFNLIYCDVIVEKVMHRINDLLQAKGQVKS